MTYKTKKERIKEGLRLIKEKEPKRKNQDYLGKDIAWVFFTEYTYGSEVLKYLDSKEYKRRNDSYTDIKTYVDKLKEKAGKGDEKAKKRLEKWKETKSVKYLYTTPKNTNRINDCFKLWKDLSFFDEERRYRKIKSQKIASHNKLQDTFRLSLNPFFEDCKKIKIRFSDEERRLLNYIFSSELTRKALFREYKKEDFIISISKFYLKYFFIPYHLKKLNADYIKKIQKDFNFNQEYIKRIINPQLYLRKTKDYDIDVATLEPDDKRLSRKEVLAEEKREIEIEKKGIYYIDFYLKKARSGYHLKESNQEVYLTFYTLLHRYYPNIIDLDKKMLEIEGLGQDETFIPDHLFKEWVFGK